MSIETNQADPLQSRWGFHPCDQVAFRKLKFLHQWYWQTLYDFHRWHRWWRKEPQNRVGGEPAFCPAFVRDEVWYKPVKFHGEAGFKVYPKTVVDLGIVSLYQSARMPQPQPVAALDPETLARIDTLHRQVEEFLQP